MALSTTHLLVGVISLLLLLVGCEASRVSGLNCTAALNTDITTLSKQGCLPCKLVVANIQRCFTSEQTIETIASFVINTCTRLNLFSHEVCAGTIHEMQDEVIRILGARFLDPTHVCARVGACPPIPTPPPLEFPPRTTPRRQAQCGKSSGEVGSFIHITDVHYDELYKQGAAIECANPLCCREGTPGNGTARKWGEYSCDLPLNTLQHMLSFIDQLQPKPDFLLYTGDDSAHDIWAQTRELQIQRARALSKVFENQLPGWSVFQSVGNHECFAVDQFVLPQDNWLLETLADSWSPWLGPEQQQTIQQAGFYEMKIESGLRVISLNTQYCDILNFNLLLNSSDPGGQLVWLNQTLTLAETNNERVYIIGHIAPGDVTCLYNYASSYWQLVDRFNDTIVGQMFGHTHRDSYQLFMDIKTKTQPIGVGYVAPSVTPHENINPSFRLFFYDKQTKELLNYYQYSANLEQANEQGEPQWLMTYNPITNYNMSCLTPQQWQNFTNRMKSTEGEDLFVEFRSHWQAGGPSPPCDSLCRNNTLCEVSGSTYHDVMECQGSEDSPANRLVRAINNLCW